jgi:hypothetical protein
VPDRLGFGSERCAGLAEDRSDSDGKTLTQERANHGNKH